MTAIGASRARVRSSSAPIRRLYRRYLPLGPLLVAVRHARRQLSRCSQCIKACRAAVELGQMSDLGHSRHFGCPPVTSGLPPTPDMPLHRNN